MFNTKRKLLRSMQDYSKAWLLLLEYVEKMALSETAEVSLAALKAMQVSQGIQIYGDQKITATMLKNLIMTSHWRYIVAD